MEKLASVYQEPRFEGHCNKGSQFDDEAYGANKESGRIATIPMDSSKRGDTLSISKPKGWGARHSLVVYGFTGLCVLYMTRVNLSIGIVGMVGTNSSRVVANDSEICPFPEDWNATSGGFTSEGEFDWDETTQGILLGCFFWGYAASSFFGGLVAEYYGSRIVMTASVFLSSLMSILSPICARTSIGLFIAARVVAGLAQGPCLPCIHNLLATWNPPEDRARFASVVLPGMNIGTILALSLGGLMNESDFLGGWPSIFYVFGIVGILWCIPWFIYMRDSPQQHKGISQEELRYIQHNESSIRNTMRMKVPWSDIFTSLPFWSLIVFSWGDNFGFYTILTEIPTYLKNIQHFGSTDTGLTSSLPHLISSVVSVIWGAIADTIIAKTSLSVTGVRKLSTAIGQYGSVLSLIAMCFVDCNSSLSVAVLCITMGIGTFSGLGGALCEQDIAPNLTAALKGITNTAGAMSGIITPLIAGFITSNNQTLEAWRAVFLITSGTYFVCCTFFLIFATSDIQPWNFPKDKKEKNKY